MNGADNSSVGDGRDTPYPGVIPRYNWFAGKRGRVEGRSWGRGRWGWAHTESFIIWFRWAFPFLAFCIYWTYFRPNIAYIPSCAHDETGNHKDAVKTGLRFSVSFTSRAAREAEICDAHVSNFADNSDFVTRSRISEIKQTLLQGEAGFFIGALLPVTTSIWTRMFH